MTKIPREDIEQISWKKTPSASYETAQDTSKKMNIVVELTPEKLREVISSNQLLNDVFFVNDEWIIEVKQKEQSEILRWHFWVVPGVVLRELYELVMWIENNKSTTNFNSLVRPWNGLIITESWIKDEQWNEIISYTSWVEILESIPEEVELWVWDSVSSEEASKYILQRPPFRFVSITNTNIKTSWKINEWDIIEWSFDITHDFTFSDNNWIIERNLFDEIAAQILSLWASKILNWEEWLESKGAKILTFAQSKVDRRTNEVSTWETILCKAVVTKIEKRDVEVYYELTDSKWRLIQIWVIQGNIIKKAFIDRLNK